MGSQPIVGSNPTPSANCSVGAESHALRTLAGASPRRRPRVHPDSAGDRAVRVARAQQTHDLVRGLTRDLTRDLTTPLLRPGLGPDPGMKKGPPEIRSPFCSHAPASTVSPAVARALRAGRASPRTSCWSCTDRPASTWTDGSWPRRTTRCTTSLYSVSLVTGPADASSRTRLVDRHCGTIRTGGPPATRPGAWPGRGRCLLHNGNSSATMLRTAVDLWMAP